MSKKYQVSQEEFWELQKVLQDNIPWAFAGEIGYIVENFLAFESGELREFGDLSHKQEEFL